MCFKIQNEKIGLEEETGKRKKWRRKGRSSLWNREKEKRKHQQQQCQLSPPPACVLCYLDLSRSNSEEIRGWDITEDKSLCLRSIHLRMKAPDRLLYDRHGDSMTQYLNSLCHPHPTHTSEGLCKAGSG